MCAVLKEANLIERYDFDDVSGKCKVRIQGRWSKAEKEDLLKLAKDKEPVLQKLNAVRAY